MPPQSVRRRAVALLGSGPTGGVMGAALAAARSGVHDLVAADMGGTSYDVCLVAQGQPAIATDWNWRHRYYVNLPMVDVHSVGAGGGSIARVRQGALLVGPDSAGSIPGPVCYGRGGVRPTVTDSDAALGYLPAKGFAGGRMELEVEAGRAAIERDVAAAVLSAPGSVIIASGGGFPTLPENRALVRERNALVFNLALPFDDAWRRVDSATGRPLAKDCGRAKALFDAREPVYREFCDYEVSALGAPGGVADEIIAAFGYAREMPRFSA